MQLTKKKKTELSFLYSFQPVIVRWQSEDDDAKKNLDIVSEKLVRKNCTPNPN